MKFKIEARDLLIFCVYALLMLYLCAIAVLNFTSITTDGTFYGLMPFRAFIMPYLPITIGMFVISLIIVFTSVSSYIFNRDKNGGGFGFEIGSKNSDGYSRWAKTKEIKNSSNVKRVVVGEKVEAAGVPLINNGKEIWVDDGEYHSLIIGSSGSGKTQTIVKPLVKLLTQNGESMVITDPKGEIYRASADYLKSCGYKVIVLNFREPSQGNAWNPLALPYQYYKAGDRDKATELLDDVALNILYDPSSKSDSDFWEKSAADYFSGLALGLFIDAKEKEVNLNSINLMSTVGEERYATSNYIKEYFHLKGEDSSPYIFASNTINAPNDTKGGILSTFRQKIRLFSTRESLSEMLAYSDFDMRDIGREKTAVFMVIHDEKKTYHSLMTIFIKQCYETLIDVAQENGGKLKQRTNFILDEFANMPPLKDVDSMVSAARSRDIRFTFIIQNFAQLNDVYGKEVAEIIKGNCGNLIYLISTEMAALDEISKMCGEVKSSEKDKTASTPLVTVSDLQKLKLFEAIIIRLRTNPFKTKLEPDFKMKWDIPNSEADYPSREIHEVQMFDLKKFVTEEKQKQMMEKNNGMTPGMGGFSPNGMGNNPFMGGMNNPFMGGGMNSNPFMGSQRPAMPNPNQNSFGGSPFGAPKQNMDIDAMMRDIDRKIKELEEEEAREKAEKEKQKNAEDEKSSSTLVSKEKTEPEVSVSTNLEPKTLEEPKVNISQEKANETKKESVSPALEVESLDVPPVENKNKPIVNIDADSVVVNENVITDDEFFDDFFTD
ncbi:MAG: type IV secretory system conjugative DNA transfer family protein [Bacilli bacterium]|nr:type IV secretory system conjugative DNA transfer family protein [Bacilli bacterium]